MKKSDVTYDQLKEALQRLGFIFSTGVNSFGISYFHYENEIYDAVILLRSGSDQELVYAVDILAAERTLENRGVADQETFDRLLHETARKEAQAA